jgi:Baseplate J-like protein.
VTPRTERIALIPLTVVADTTATQPDPTRGVVPADLISIPVSVNDTFKATGKRVALTKATGTVRFENFDPTSTNRIDAGSIVRTDSGVRFRTDVTITVPSGNLVPDPGGGIKDVPGTATVKVTAVDGGPDGNIDSNKIDHVPSGENSIFLKVTNLEPTTGGKRQEFSRVTQPDVDGALAALNLSLQQAFVEAMADPSLATGGATVFPSTGRLAEPTTDIPPDTLVGQEVPTFALSLSATGTVIAVDAAPVSGIADTQLRAAVKAGHELVPGSEEIQVGEAVIVGQSVSFPVTASAEQIAILDPEVLKKAVLGKSIDEARAILAPYGEVSLTISPDWTGSVPGFESRVTLTIGHAVQIETPTPSGATPTTRTDTPTDAPTPSAPGSGTP